MPVWVVRAGGKGQFEDLALESGHILIGFNEFGNLSQFKSYDEIKTHGMKLMPDNNPKQIINWASQLWNFIGRIKQGEYVVMPLKTSGSIAVGKITGEYEYINDNPEGARNARKVNWIAKDLPRSSFDMDLLYSFGAFLTVGQVKRDRAEERLKNVIAGIVIPEPLTTHPPDGEELDLYTIAKDQLIKLIEEKFTGHRLAELVNEILIAQGYKTLVSPPGADGGVDILAGKGTFGFDPPRLCVQVKSGKEQIGEVELRGFRTVVRDNNAGQGLFISWSGFKRNIHKDEKTHFFEHKLWDQLDLINAFLDNYDLLSEEIKAEIPLKKIWIVVKGEEEV